MREWRHRSRSLDGHGNLAASAIGGRIEHDIDAGDFSRAEGFLERGTKLLGLGDMRALAAERLHHLVEAREGQRGTNGALGAEEGQLRVPDLSPAAVIADDDG